MTSPYETCTPKFVVGPNGSFHIFPDSAKKYPCTEPGVLEELMIEAYQQIRKSVIGPFCSLVGDAFVDFINNITATQNPQAIRELDRYSRRP